RRDSSKPNKRIAAQAGGDKPRPYNSSGAKSYAEVNARSKFSRQRANGLNLAGRRSTMRQRAQRPSSPSASLGLSLSSAAKVMSTTETDAASTTNACALN